MLPYLIRRIESGYVRNFSYPFMHFLLYVFNNLAMKSLTHGQGWRPDNYYKKLCIFVNFTFYNKQSVSCLYTFLSYRERL